MAKIEIMSISLEENEAIQFAAKAAAISYAMNNGDAKEIESGFINAVMSLVANQLMGDKESFQNFNKNILDLALLNAASFNHSIVSLAEEAKAHIQEKTKH